MTPNEAKDVMLAVFLAHWVGAGMDANRIVWDDLPGSVPDGMAPWARVKIKHLLGTVRAFGDRGALYSNTGILAIQVFTFVGDAKLTAYTLAHHVVTAYRKAKNEGVSFRNAHLKEVGTSGAFEQTNVLTDFSYDD